MGSKSGNHPGHRKMARDQYFGRVVRSAVFRNLFAGKLYRLGRLAQNISSGTSGGRRKKLAVFLISANAFRSGRLYCKRQACNDKQSAEEQSCHPMAIALKINVCDHLRQNWELSLIIPLER